MFWIIVILAVIFFIEFLRSQGKSDNSQTNKNKKFDNQYDVEKDSKAAEAQRKNARRLLKESIEIKNKAAIAKKTIFEEQSNGVIDNIDSTSPPSITNDPADLLLAQKITNRVSKAISSQAVALNIVRREFDSLKESDAASREFIANSGFLISEFRGALKQTFDEDVQLAIRAVETSAIGLVGDAKKTEIFRLLNLQNLIDEWRLKDACFLEDRLRLSLKALLKSDSDLHSFLDICYPPRGRVDIEDIFISLPRGDSWNKSHDAYELVERIRGLTGQLGRYIVEQEKILPRESDCHPDRKNRESIAGSVTSDASNYEDLFLLSSLKLAALNKNIPYLTHFTAAVNLSAILRNGLQSRANLDEKGWTGAINDQLRLDGRRNGISLSVAFPNYKMFYKYRINDVSKKWVVLRIQPSVIWEKECLFFRKNAADRDMISLRKEVLTDKEAFELMYSDKNCRTENLKDFDPTDPQAEVMVIGDIPLRKIVDVVFDDRVLMTHYASRFPNVKMTYDPGFFSSRGYFRDHTIGL